MNVYFYIENKNIEKLKRDYKKKNIQYYKMNITKLNEV